MGKLFKKIGGLVLGVVGAAIGFVVAGPAGAAIGFSVGMGIGTAVQMAAMKTKVPSTSSATGARLSVSIDPDAFRKIAFGETALGTDQRYWESFGPENSYFDQVIAAAGHEIESFGKLFFDDEEVTFSGDNATGAYAGALSKQDRTVGVTATALTVGAGSLWTSAASMTGVAHYALKIQWSQEKYPRGIPSRITRIGKGAKVYDPRRDSTQPGGSGSHRANDQSTWQYSPVDSNGVAIGRNPALQILWYELGWRVTNPDTSEAILVCGRGRPIDDIDFASFITAANDCETEEYYSDALLSTGDAHETNIAVLEAACAGKLMDTGGRIGLRIRNDTTGDIAQAFTDGDVLDADAAVWRPRLPLSERWNQGIGSFVDPRALYKVVPFPVVRDAAYETEDGFKRPGPGFRFDAVQDGEQAQRLVRLELNISRYQGVFTAPFNWRAKKVRIWDCVTLTFPRLGFSSKIFRVLEKKTDPMGAIWLLLREDDPSIYDGGTVTPIPAPVAGAGYDARVVTAPDAGDWTVTPVYFEGGGAKLPALLILGDALAPNIVAVRISYRQSSEVDWVSLGRFTTRPPVRTGIPNIAPDTDYDIRLVYENAYGAFSSPTDLGPFTSLDEFSALTAGIADLIVGQGWGATAAEADASNALVPAGVNLLLQPLFNIVSGYWTSVVSVAATQAVAEAQGVRYYQSTLTGSPASGSTVVIRQVIAPNVITPVIAGQKFAISGLLGTTSLSSVNIRILWYDAAASYIADTTVQTVTSPSLAGGAGIDSYLLMSGLAVAPAGAYFGAWYAQGIANGGASPRLRVSQPLLARVDTGSLVVPPWSLGFPAIPGADPTATFAVTMNPRFPLSSSSSTSIAVAATTITRPNESFSLPSATISGLTADTNYAVFRDIVAGTYVAASSGIDTYATNLARYLPLGAQRTQLGGGGFSPPPSPPSGGGGGGSGGSGGFDWNYVAP